MGLVESQFMAEYFQVCLALILFNNLIYFNIFNFCF